MNKKIKSNCFICLVWVNGVLNPHLQVVQRTLSAELAQSPCPAITCHLFSNVQNPSLLCSMFVPLHGDCDVTCPAVSTGHLPSSSSQNAASRRRVMKGNFNSFVITLHMYHWDVFSRADLEYTELARFCGSSTGPASPLAAQLTSAALQGQPGEQRSSLKMEAEKRESPSLTSQLQRKTPQI